MTGIIKPRPGYALAGAVDGRPVYSRTAAGLDTEAAAEALALAILRQYGGPEGLRQRGLALRREREEGQT